MRGARPKRVNSKTKRSVPKIRGHQRSGSGNGISRRPPDLQRNERLIEVLNAAALEAQNTLTSDALFAAMSKVLRRVGIRCIVMLADSDPASFVIRHMSFSRRLLTAARAATGTDPVGYRIHVKQVREYRNAVRERSAAFVEDARELFDRFLPKAAARYSGRVARIFSLKQSIVAPLIAEGRVFGLLTVHSNTLRPTDTTAINVFANQLAAAWRRNELFDEAQEEIARRRETEAYLIEERDRFRSILDIAGVILVVLDKYGRIVLINRKGQDILGYEKKDLLGKNWFDTCLPRASRKEVKAVFRDLISGKGGLSEYVKNKIIVRSGEERTIAWHNAVIRGAGGRITGTLSSGEDVTEQEKTERALLASEKKFRTLVESVHDIVFTTDLQQRYTGVFGLALSTPGISSSALIGRTVREVYGKEAAAVHEAAMARALKGKHVVYDWSIPGGELTLYFQTSLSPLKDAEGRIIGLVGVGRDISVWKRDEQLMRLQRDLIRELAKVSKLQDGLRRCLKTALEISEMDCGGIYLFDFDSGALRLAHHHGLSPEFIRVTSEFEPGSTHVKMVSKGESIFTEHLRLAVPKDPIKKKEGLHAIAVIPIRHEGKVIGCLNIASHIKDEVPSFSRESLDTLANEIGGSIAGLQMQEALEKSETQYRNLVENVAVGVVSMDTEGNCTFVNEIAGQMTGYAPKEILGKHFTGFLDSDDRSRIMDFFHRSLVPPFGKDPVEYRLKHKNGRILHIVSSITVLMHQERVVGLNVILQDITERKKAEADLKQSENKYRSMVLAAPIGVGVVVNRVFTEVNDSVCAMTGYRREELLGKSSLMVYPSEEEFRRVGKYKYDQIREKGVGHIDTAWKRKDGEIRDIYLSSAPILPNDLSKGTTFTALDITDRKWAEQSLRESETRYRALVENSLIGIGISRGDRVLYANRSLMHMFGYHDFNELAANPLPEYLAPQSRVLLQEWRLRRARGEPVPMELELDILRKDGEVRSLRLNMTRITIGNEECVYSAFSDITENKQAQMRLQQESSFNSAIIRSTMEGLAVAHAVPRHPFILFTVWNDRMQEITGYTMEEINRIGWHSAMNPDPRMQKKAAERVERIFAGDDMADEEWIITRSDGEERTVSMSTSRLDTGSDDVHALVMTRDVTERRRAEQALRESEKQYRTTIDFMGNAIHVMDQDKRFVLFNKAFQDWNRSLGLKSNVIGKTLFEVFPFLPESVGREYDDVFHSGQLLATQEKSTVNGRELFTETRKIPIMKDNRVIQVVTVLTDITERKSAERALIRSEELFRQLAENIHEVFWVMDFKTRRIEYVSHAFEEIWGRPCGSIYEDSELFRKTIHPDDFTKMRTADKMYRLTGMLDEQIRIIRPDRTIRWVRARTYPVKDTTGDVFRTVGVAEDITDFKHAEESLAIQHRALIESSAALNAFINALPEPAMLIDTRYRVIVANSAMARSFGKSNTDLVGLDSSVLFPPADWESTRKAVDSVVQTGQEMHFEGVRNGRFYVNYVTPAFTPAGEVTRVAVFELDITDRIKAEETLKRSQDAFRLASLGTLAGGDFP